MHYGSIVDEDDLEENQCKRVALWLSCIFVMAAIIIGGIILILWNCGVI